MFRYLLVSFSALLRAEIVEILVATYPYGEIVGFSALLRAEIVETDVLNVGVKGGYSFSALLRAEIVEIVRTPSTSGYVTTVSVLFYEPKLLKRREDLSRCGINYVSVLFYEPKLLKVNGKKEMRLGYIVSVLFYEPKLLKFFIGLACSRRTSCFSALLRAEIVETDNLYVLDAILQVSVLFYEPKLLKRGSPQPTNVRLVFQCSSTSRNC